jgi:L-threonylcarbamoyladenylate synthase
MNIVPTTEIDSAAHALDEGKLVIVPTERWYMLCADAGNTNACSQIFTAKQRSTTHSLAFIARSLDHVREVFVLNPQAERLAWSFWPGHLALTLPWRDQEVGAQCAAVGAEHALVTCDDGPLGMVASKATVPIAATSVNVSSDASDAVSWPAITIDEVRHFVDRSDLDVAFCLDGGICPAASHLTIVDCIDGNAKLVRAGLVHERAVAAALKCPISVPRT